MSTSSDQSTAPTETPAPAPGHTPGAGDATELGGPPPGAPVAEYTPVHTRVYETSTTDLWKAIAAKHAEAAKADEPPPADDPDDIDDVDIPAPGQEAAPAQAQQPAPQPAPQVQQPAPQPTIQAPPPVDAKAAIALEVKERAIAEREAAFAEREKALEAREKEIAERAVADFKTQQALGYYERGTEALTDLFKEWTGIASEDEITDEWAAIIGDSSGRYLKLAVEPEVSAKLQGRRALHKVTAHTKSLEAKARDLETRLAREKAAEESRRAEEQKRLEAARAEETKKAEDARHHAAVAAHLKTAEIAAQYPNLMLEGDPARLILDVARELYEQIPTKEHTFADAAGLAEAHLKQRNQDLFTRLSPLYQKAPPQAAAPTAAPKQATQGAPQGRGAGQPKGTLTNGTSATIASQPTAPTPQTEDVDPAEVRRQSLMRLEKALRQRAAAQA